MKEVLIHIGMHKTGSTSIQDALRGYRDQNTRVASFSEKNHSIPIFTLFSQRRYDYHIWKNRGLSRAQIDRKAEEYAQILADDCRDGQYERLIISGEDISTLAREEMHRLVETFQTMDLKVKVILFVRQPVALVSSVVQELIKNGHRSFGPYNLQYQSRIQPFQEILPPDNIVVEDFDRMTGPHTSVVSRFASLAQIDQLVEKRSNESMSSQALALVYKLNNVPLQLTGHPGRYKARRAIVERIRAAFSLGSGFEKPDPEMFACLLDSAVDKECAYLEENFGIVYENRSFKADPGKLIEYFNQSLVGFDAEIEGMFGALGVAYNPKEDLETNFLEAVVSLIESRQLHGNGKGLHKTVVRLIGRKSGS